MGMSMKELAAAAELRCAGVARALPPGVVDAIGLGFAKPSASFIPPGVKSVLIGVEAGVLALSLDGMLGCTPCVIHAHTTHHTREEEREVEAERVGGERGPTLCRLRVDRRGEAGPSVPGAEGMADPAWLSMGVGASLNSP
jgi:hypothetical protein